MACLLTPTAAGQNHPPVANDDTLVLSSPQPLRIAASTLLANDTDLDNDTLFVMSAGDADGATQAGGTVVRYGTAIFYTPPSGAIATDSFTYVICDSFGAQAFARVTLNFTPTAPPTLPVVTPPQPQSDGTVQLSGNAPSGSTVTIYYTTDISAGLWKRDVTLTVPASGQWSVNRPATQGGAAVFYRAEIQDRAP